MRSSKGEIVLGLTIGLGVSLLLAGLGQAFLRGGGAIAEEQSAPSRLESSRLGARPEVPAGLLASSAASSTAPLTVASAASDGAEPNAAGPNAAAGASASSPLTAVSPGGVSLGGVSLGGVSLGAAPAAGEAPAFTGTVRAGDDGALLAQARPANAKRASRVLPRAAAARATRAQGAAAIAVEPPLEDAVDADQSLGAHKSLGVPSEREPSPAPLTPAQSAGLGLDLPL